MLPKSTQPETFKADSFGPALGGPVTPSHEAFIAAAGDITATQPLRESIPTPHSDNLATIPNAMTLYRAVEGAGIVVSMVHGGKNASRHITARTVLAGLSDFESQVARRIEPHFPGRGYSKIGKRTDPIADTEFGAGLTAGILLSRRASLTAKVGSAITGAKIGKQVKWATAADKEHRKITGEPLVADVGIVGKIATASMIGSAIAGALTHDLDPSKPRQKEIRRAAGLASIALSTVGYILGESARKKHDVNLQAKLAPLREKV